MENTLKKMSEEDLVVMVEALSNVLFDVADATFAEMLLRREGLESRHLEAIGFDVAR